MQLYLPTELPHPELTVLSTHPDKPNHGALIQLHKEMNANASSIHSPGGDGTRGHLPLTISPADYLALTGVAHPAPVYPGANPIDPPGATQHVITEANRVHAADLSTHATWHRTNNICKQTLLHVVDPIYFGGLDKSRPCLLKLHCISDDRPLVCHLRHS